MRELETGSQTSQEPLITQGQLASMENGQALIMISGRTRYIEWLPDFTEMFDHSKWKPPTPRKPHKNKPLSFFDMKELVTKQFNEKIDAIMNGGLREDKPVRTNEKPVDKKKLSELEEIFRSLPEEKPDPSQPPWKSDKPKEAEKPPERPCLPQAPRKTEKSRNERTPSEGTAFREYPYHILVANGRCKTNDVVEMIAAFTGISVQAVVQMMKYFPFELTFKTQKEASDFIQKIRNVGGAAKNKRTMLNTPPGNEAPSGKAGDSLPC